MKTFERRSRLLLAVFTGLYALVGLRYLYLQSFASAACERKSRELRVREDRLPYRRGAILDRSGRILVEDVRTFDLVLRPAYFLRGSALGSLFWLTSALGPSAESGEPDPRLRPRRPVDDALRSVPAARRAGGARSELSTQALRLALRSSGLDESPLDAALDEPSVNLALGIPAPMRLQLEFTAATRPETFRDLVLASLAAKGGGLRDLAERPRAFLDALVAVRRSEIDALPSAELRREAEEAVGALFDVPTPDVRAGLRGALRYDSLDSILTALGGESPAARAERKLAVELEDLARLAAKLGERPVNLLERVDRTLLAAEATLATRWRRESARLGTSRLSDLALDRAWLRVRNDIRHRERLLVRSVSEEVALEVGIGAPALAGLSIREASDRRARAEMAPHLVGFVQRGRTGDATGQMGIEKALDARLRGVAGRERVERDVRGREVGLIERTEPRRGQDVVLTLDGDMQAAAERAIAGHRGSIVAVDPRSGDVLAATSAPGFSIATVREEYARLRSDRLLEPLRSRVVLCPPQPYPGSTFKVVAALAGLEEGVITPETRFECRGYLHVPTAFRCLGVHGSVDLREALARSCNVYFYHLGESLGGERLATWGRRFGFGGKTGLTVAENIGRVISPADGRGRWTTADSRFLAIGQSRIEVTPAQVARMMAGVAAGGRLPSLREVLSVGGNATPGTPPEDLHLSAASLAAVKAGLVDVVRHGTAAGKGLERFGVAGKSGTAETGERDEKTHAWFAGYAPADRPEIVVSVFLEFEGLHGGDAAAPVAEKVFAAYFGPTPERPR